MNSVRGTWGGRIVKDILRVRQQKEKNMVRIKEQIGHCMMSTIDTPKKKELNVTVAQLDIITCCMRTCIDKKDFN